MLPLDNLLHIGHARAAKNPPPVLPDDQAHHQKIFSFPKERNYDLSKRSRASQEGRFAIATTRGAGCDGRVVPQDVRHDAYGQAVWSCPPDAGVKSIEILIGDGG